MFAVCNTYFVKKKFFSIYSEFDNPQVTRQTSASHLFVSEAPRARKSSPRVQKMAAAGLRSSIMEERLPEARIRGTTRAQRGRLAYPDWNKVRSHHEVYRASV